MTYEELVPVVPTRTFTPRIFGFKIHPSSSSIARQNMGMASGTSYSSSNMIGNSNHPIGSSSLRMGSQGHEQGPGRPYSTSANSSADSKCSVQLPENNNNRHADDVTIPVIDEIIHVSADALMGMDDYLEEEDDVAALSVSKTIGYGHGNGRSRFSIDVHNLSAIDDHKSAGHIRNNAMSSGVTNSVRPDIDTMSASTLQHRNYIVELEEDKQHGHDDDGNALVKEGVEVTVEEGHSSSHRSENVIFKKPRIH